MPTTTEKNCDTVHIAVDRDQAIIQITNTIGLLSQCLVCMCVLCCGSMYGITWMCISN